MIEMAILDVKPDNILVDWSQDKQGRVEAERVALIDLDCSLKLKGDRLLRLPGAQRIGNYMWLSPEGHTGLGIGKPSDLFSYGLVVSGFFFLQKNFLLTAPPSAYTRSRV